MPKAIFHAIWRYGECLFATAEDEVSTRVKETSSDERERLKKKCPLSCAKQNSHPAFPFI